MSTEQQQPQQQAKQEPSALATGLANTWDRFKSGQLISYPLMGLILLVVVGGVVGGWIWWEKKKSESARWRELDAATSPEQQDEIIKKHPNTTQSRIASLQIARAQIGPDGLELFAHPDPTVREGAVASVEKARDSFAKLAEEFKDDSLIRAECLYSIAMAESALVGMNRAGSEQSRGDKSKAIEYCTKAAEAAPNTDWATRATKLATWLQNDELTRLHQTVYRPDPFAQPPQPKLPPGHPTVPGFPSPPPGR